MGYYWLMNEQGMGEQETIESENEQSLEGVIEEARKVLKRETGSPDDVRTEDKGLLNVITREAQIDLFGRKSDLQRGSPEWMEAKSTFEKLSDSEKAIALAPYVDEAITGLAEKRKARETQKGRAYDFQNDQNLDPRRASSYEVAFPINVAEKLGITNSPDVLDYGSGSGGAAVSLAGRLKASSVTLTEQPQSELEGYSNIHVVETDRDAVPSTSERFDLVTAIDVFQHIIVPTDDQTREQRYEVALAIIEGLEQRLKDGGKIVVAFVAPVDEDAVSGFIIFLKKELEGKPILKKALVVRQGTKTVIGEEMIEKPHIVFD